MVWKRKNDEGEVEIVVDFEGHVDRLVREARDAGLFDNLSGKGKPLKLEDNPFAGEWSSAYRMISNAGATLPWIDLGKEIGAMQEERKKLIRRAEQSAETMRRITSTRPEYIPWYRQERERQRKAYMEYVKLINREIERFNWMCPVYSLAKATLQLKYELQRFDQAWPSEA